MVSALKYTFTFLSFLFELLAADNLVSGVNYILSWLRYFHFVIVLFPYSASWLYRYYIP